MDLTEIRSRLASAEAVRAVAAFEARCGKFGSGLERRTTTLEGVEVRDSGNADVAFTVVGHAAMYGRKSLDIGGFQEVIEKGAFSAVLDSAPDVWLRWDHDPRLSMARTKSPQYTLELTEDPKGLRFYSKVAPTSFAADLRILMESGIIDQASFAFSDVDDTWTITEKNGTELVTRTIQRIGALYDVTITAEGAYPSTDSSVVRSLAVAFAMDTGRLEDRAASPVGDIPDEAADEIPPTVDPAATDAPVGDSEGDDAAQDPLIRRAEAPSVNDEPGQPVDVEQDDDAPDAPEEESDSADGDQDEQEDSHRKRKARLRMAASIARHRADLE